MYEDYRREVLLELAKVLSDDQQKLMLAISAVDKVSAKYKIEPKLETLVPLSEITKESVKAYLATCSVEGQSEGTIHNKYYCLTKFFNCTGLPIDRITTNDIRAYLYTVKEHISNSRAEKTRQILNHFFNYCIDEEILIYNPCKKIRPIKCDKKEIQPLSDSELTAIQNACETPREKALVEFLYATAARISEAAGIKISSVNFDTLEVKLFGKGRKERTAFLRKESVPIIKAYLATRSDDCEYLFVSSRGHHKVTTDSLRDELHNISRRAGLYINPHQIRHTTATNLQGTMPIQNISKYLGHENISTTMIYAKIDRAAMREQYTETMSAS